MPETKNESIGEVKIFFVVPELSTFPEEFLKSFFLMGYETYFLDDDPYCPLEAKIHALFALFPQLILFFNIDRPIRGIDWPIFMNRLQRKYGDRAKIGVTYHKRYDPEEVRRLERLYLYTIGIVCGCIPLEYQKMKNLHIIRSVLAANQANGRRKYLRALCGDTYKARIAYAGADYQGIVRDVSLSHFSCVFTEEGAAIPLHEKIEDIYLNLRGVILHVDGVLSLQRVVGAELLNVFVFRTAAGREGLDREHLQKVNDLIFHNLRAKMDTLLSHEYAAIRRDLLKNRRAQVEAVVAAPDGAFLSAGCEDVVDAVG